MIIDVSDILKEVGASEELKGSMPVENIVYQGEELIFNAPVNIEGSVVNCGDFLLVKASAAGSVMMTCDRCAERFEYKFKYDFDARFKKTPDPDDPDVFVYEDEKIELVDAVIEFFLLNLPLRKLCSEDCKGLCPWCGANLNKTVCNCREQKPEPEHGVDSRLAALANFFSSNDKEV